VELMGCRPSDGSFYRLGREEEKEEEEEEE
jgi:hypothetical protein